MSYFKRITEFIQKNRLARHLLFWLVIFLIYIPAGRVGLEHDPLKSIIILNLCIQVPQVLAAYFLSYFLVPKLVLKKRYVHAVIWFIVSVYVFSALGRILTVHVGEEMVRARPFEQESFREILSDVYKLFAHYFPVIYSVSFQFLFVKFFLDYKKTKDEQLLLSKEKAEAELKTLKAQLNPHFLFNTLNNLYSLSLDNSPKTPLAISKLSDMLDHVLYKCDKQLVPLSSEIELLKNYIELEKLRYDERLIVNFKTKIEKDIEIPPLILLSLLENAFKHGAGEDRGSPEISVSIDQKDKLFVFEISNTVAKDYVSNSKAAIGLINIRKQLDLIYNTNYSLNIQPSPGFFKVTLEIHSHEN